MANTFHHAPNIGAKSRSPNIVLGVSGTGLMNRSPASPVAMSPGSVLVDPGCSLTDNLITWFQTGNFVERRQV